MNVIRSDLYEYSPASNLAQNDVIRERKSRGEQVVNLGFGQSPFPIPAHAVEELRRHAGNSLYLPACGIQQLRQAVVDFHRHFDNFRHFDPDCVVCGPGSKELIFLILLVFDGTVFLASPSWTTYKPQTLLTGRRCVTLPLKAEENWKISAELLQRFASGCHGNKLLIINNPDNPTGQAYSSQELAALGAVLKSHNFIVISDEIYARLHFDAAHRSIAQELPEATIVTSGISKWASAGGWRLGYALFPKELQELRAAVTSAGTHTFSCAAAPVQHAAAALLANLEEAEEFQFHCRRILRAMALHSEQKLRAAGAQVLAGEAGYYLLPDLQVAAPGLRRLGLRSGEEMSARILRDTGVAVMAAGPAFLRPAEELTIRLCFVDFDGVKALQESRRLGRDEQLGEDFTEKFCQPAHSAIDRLADWLRNMSQN